MKIEIKKMGTGKGRWLVLFIIVFNKAYYFIFKQGRCTIEKKIVNNSNLFNNKINIRW